MKEKRLTNITLDKERHLHFDLNALEKFEELTGTTIDKIGTSMSMKVLKSLIYVGLIHEDNSLTPEMVGALIGFEDIEKVSNAIADAFGDLK